MEEARSCNPEVAGSDSTLRHPFTTRAASRNFPMYRNFPISVCVISRKIVSEFSDVSEFVDLEDVFYRYPYRKRLPSHSQFGSVTSGLDDGFFRQLFLQC